MGVGQNDSRPDGVHNITRGVLSLVIGIIAGTLARVYFPQLPTISELLGKTISWVEIWTSSTAVSSTREFVLVSVLAITVASFYVNWRYKESPSPIVSAVMESPDISIWIRILSHYRRIPILNTVLPILGTVAVVYSVGIILTIYLIYVALYLASAGNPLLISSVSIILASATFGAIYGRIQKGFVLALQNRIEIESGRVVNQNDWRTVGYRLLIVPSSSLISLMVTHYKISSLREAELAQVFSISISVFISTFLFSLLGFYLFWTLLQFVQIVGRGYTKYIHGDGDIRKEVKNNIKNYVDKGFSKENSEQSNNVFPDDVAEALRDSATRKTD